MLSGMPSQEAAVGAPALVIDTTVHSSGASADSPTGAGGSGGASGAAHFGGWLSHLISRRSSLDLSSIPSPMMRAFESQTSSTMETSALRAVSFGSAVAMLPPQQMVPGVRLKKVVGASGSGSMRRRAAPRTAARHLLRMTSEETLGLDPTALGGKLAAPGALKRDLDCFNQIGVCIGVCAYLYMFAGVNSLAAWMNGGPASMLWGWIFAVTGFIVSSASLAELTSACPTASGLYFFTARLAPRRWMPYLSFMVGTSNVIGAVTGLALLAQQCANMGLTFWHLCTIQPVLESVFDESRGHLVTVVTGWTGGHPAADRYEVLGFYTLFVVICGGINMVPIQISAWVTSAGAFCNLLFGPVISIIILVVAPTHRPASFVFGTLLTHPEVTGVSSPGFAFLLGTSASVGCLYGYDTCMYLVEESHDPTVTAPRGMFWGVVITGGVGLVTIISILFSLQDVDATFDLAAVAGGTQCGQQLLWDIFAARYGGDGRLSLGLVAMLGISLFLVLALWNLGTARKMYALARDKLLPRSDLFCSVSERGVPVNATLLTGSLQLLLGTLLLADSDQLVFMAAVACSGVISFSSYLVPLVVRLISGVQMQPGPFNLGRWRTPITVVAAVYLVLAHVIVCLPQVYPVTWANMNYAAPVWAAVLLGLHVCWFLPKSLGARHWARGPVSGVIAGVNYRL